MSEKMNDVQKNKLREFALKLLAETTDEKDRKAIAKRFGVELESGKEEEFLAAVKAKVENEGDA